MARRRLGVALLVPAPQGSEIDGLRRSLGDGALDRIPSHLTLVPPVNVREDRLADALSVLREAAQVTRPMTVQLGPPGTFFPVNPVLFLRVGGPGLDQVHRLRDSLFVPPLERELTWPFVPHITVADEADPARIEAALNALVDYAVEVTFDRVHLLEEDAGRVWHPIADAPFRAPAVVGRGGLEIELTTSDHLDAPTAGWSRREAATGATPLAVTARQGGVVVGTATGLTRGARAEVDEVVVGASRRRQGIGSHLLARFMAEAGDRGAGTARARVDAGSVGEAFLRARGWAEESTHPDGVRLVRRLS